MKFPYKNYGHGILRPVIPIAISYRDRLVKYEVLVDSGADSCIFSAGLAPILGINLLKGERHYVSGITGDIESYYVHAVTIEVGGHRYSIKAGFLENINKSGYGVVGQQGFFEIFVVKFDLIKEQIELLSRPR